MQAKDLIEELKMGARIPPITCDTVKAGDTEKEVEKLALAMFATVDVIRAVKEWGADMLIVHEPTYYDHMDVFGADAVTTEKKKLLDESEITVFRYHDCMHYRAEDLISKGELHYLGLRGKVLPTPYAASHLFESDEPLTALELVSRIEERLGVAHVRIAGERNKKATRFALCFGTPGGVFDLLKSEDVEIVLVGEACEWMLAEYARDAAALGKNKSLITMGHIGSERDGMRLLAKALKDKHPQLAIRYFESGEVYTYTDEE